MAKQKEMIPTKQEQMKQQIQSYYHFWFTANRIYEDWAKKQGLNSHALFILYELYHHIDGCQQKQICERLLLPKQTVHSILQVFEKKGLVNKKIDPQDQRGKLFFLTSDGHQYAASVLEQLSQLESMALQQMTPQQRRQMAQNNASFITNLQNLL